ncbi:MAG: ImmA/IrrE family metallo-endopeptidase [Armatimonadota bacterium]
MAGLHFQDDAERYAHKAWENLSLELPVDLGQVAKRLGIDIHEREFVEEIDGVYLRLPGAPPVIAVNNSYIKPPVRRRFTLAHEIGHHLLGRRITPESRLFFLDSSGTKRTMMERACDRFAALLLMPEELVRHHYSELAHNSDCRVSIMADRFGVSSWALRRRLKELGLPLRTRRRA